MNVLGLFDAGGPNAVRFVVGTRLGSVVIDPSTGEATNANGTAPSGLVRAALWTLRALGLTVSVETPVGTFGPVAISRVLS